eukprot:GHRQ01022482.1.p2 GENE.GHRQ01022482.1~~GHRQ01022482.1.p2  ORF type:complete len:106 (-),score=5.60 GHRQ01022482.1:464-781(-)
MLYERTHASAQQVLAHGTLQLTFPYLPSALCCRPYIIREDFSPFFDSPAMADQVRCTANRSHLTVCYLLPHCAGQRGRPTVQSTTMQPSVCKHHLSLGCIVWLRC